MKLELPVPIAKDNLFEGYLKTLSCIPPFNKLRPREIQVLAELYRINFDNIAIPEPSRSRIVFHKDTRKSIGEKLGISTQDVYNLTCSLRQKGLLEDDKFNDKYAKPFLEPIEEIVFKFRVK